MSEERKILEFAAEIFMSDGIQRTTMDQVAIEMKISKKTIYRHFNSKERLVEAVLEFIRVDLNEKITVIVSGNLNAVEKLDRMGKLFLNVAKKMSGAWFNDLRIHYRELWQKLEEFRRERIYENFGKIVIQGREEGFFSDFPIEITRTIFQSAIQGILNPDFLVNNKFTADEAGKITLEIIINGILTKKGRKVFREFKLETQ